MSRETVRGAVRDFLTAPTITGLDAVYPNFPASILDGSGSFGFPAGAKHWGWIVLFVENEAEVRITTCGNTGDKEIRYTIRAEITYQSLAEAEAAQTEFDVLVDGVLGRLRSDRRLGAPSVIFEAGEGEFGVRTEYLEPVLNDTDGIVTSAGTLRLQVVEHVVG